MVDATERLHKSNGVVSTPGESRRFADQFATTNLHDLDLDDLDSASKVDEMQYSAFRILWKPYSVTEFDESVFGGL
jgi:hypothetical protein